MNPISSFVEQIAQMLRNEKRAKVEAELEDKKAELERIKNNRCEWDEFYAKKRAEKRLDLKF
jgi:hypothetical protein